MLEPTVPVEAHPVALDACGELGTGTLHTFQELLQVEWLQLRRRLHTTRQVNY